MTKETVNKSEKNMYRYGLQEKLCNLYEQSRQGKQFRHLMKLMYRSTQADYGNQKRDN